MGYLLISKNDSQLSMGNTNSSAVPAKADLYAANTRLVVALETRRALAKAVFRALDDCTKMTICLASTYPQFEDQDTQYSNIADMQRYGAPIHFADDLFDCDNGGFSRGEVEDGVELRIEVLAENAECYLSGSEQAEAEMHIAVMRAKLDARLKSRESFAAGVELREAMAALQALLVLVPQGRGQCVWCF